MKKLPEMCEEAHAFLNTLNGGSNGPREKISGTRPPVVLRPSEPLGFPSCVIPNNEGF